jgi:hypothetical protein
LDALERSEEALGLRTEVVEACASHAGPEDQQTLYARLGLARTLQRCGRSREAQAEAAGVFNIARRVCGTEHDLTKKAARIMGKPSFAEMTYGEANLVTAFSGTRTQRVFKRGSMNDSTGTARVKRRLRTDSEESS